MTFDLDYAFEWLSEKVMQLLFPRKCVFCGKAIQAGAEADVCSECFADITSERRTNAGLHVKRIRLGPARRYVDAVFCAAEYDDTVRGAMIRFKFGNRPFYGITFARIMSHYLYQSRDDFDIIIPVPVSEQRLEKRGYNQSAEICKGLSKFLGLPYYETALRKLRDTPKQSTRKGMERVKNVAGAFVADRELLAGKSVLLVDDILTTGSTLGECAVTLYDAGASKVCCATFAIASRTNDAHKRRAQMMLTNDAHKRKRRDET